MSLVRYATVRPVVFLSENSPESHLLVLRNLYGLYRHPDRSFSTKPGMWFRLDQSSPSWEELVSFADGTVPGRFRNAAWKTASDVLTSAAAMELLRRALVEGERLGLSTRSVIAVLGILSQCWFGTNESVKQRAIALATGPRPPSVATRPPEFRAPVAGVRGPVESITPTSRIWSVYVEAALAANRWGNGDLVLEGDISVWTGTHAGPNDGRDGIELQDAVCVDQIGHTLVFALADGVGTSAGAGAAARLAAFSFCRNVVSRGAATDYSADEVLRGALSFGYRRLKEFGEFLIEPDRVSELSTVAPLLDPSTTAYFLRATLEGQVDRPALCTTLLGGVIRQKNDWFELECVLVGDGIVETIAPDGQVSALFDMDRSQNALNSALSPVRQPTPEESDTRNIRLAAGSWIVISSDGLPKGNTQSIWNNLRKLSDKFPPGIVPVQPNCLAAALLDKAAATGRADPAGTLFADNLSLILVRLG